MKRSICHVPKYRRHLPCLVPSVTSRQVPLYSGTYRSKVWGSLARDRFHPSLLLVERPRSGALGPLTAIHSATSTASKRIPRSSTPVGPGKPGHPPPPSVPSRSNSKGEVQRYVLVPNHPPRSMADTVNYIYIPSSFPINLPHRLPQHRPPSQPPRPTTHNHDPPP